MGAKVTSGEIKREITTYHTLHVPCIVFETTPLLDMRQGMSRQGTTPRAEPSHDHHPLAALIDLAVEERETTVSRGLTVGGGHRSSFSHLSPPTCQS